MPRAGRLISTPQRYTHRYIELLSRPPRAAWPLARLMSSERFAARSGLPSFSDYIYTDERAKTLCARERTGRSLSERTAQSRIDQLNYGERPREKIALGRSEG